MVSLSPSIFCLASLLVATTYAATTTPPPKPTTTKPKPTPSPSTPMPTPAGPVFELGSPTFFGSGCPADSLQVVPSADGQTVSILFSEFAAQTTPKVNRDRRACNLAVPVTLQPGISIGVYRVDYRGYSYVPSIPNAYADLQVSYFFAGATGPTFKKLWSPGADEPVEITNKVGVSGVVWTPCGKTSTTFRVNAAVTAYKTAADRQEQVQIEIDTTDVTVEDGMRFFLTNRTCT
jgi:hypothetical protein